MPTGIYKRKPFTEEHRRNIGLTRKRLFKEGKLKMKPNSGSFKKGKNHSLWKGGMSRSTIKVGKTMLRSHYRWLTQNDMGLYRIPKGCVIHHKDLNLRNDDINNLILLPKDYHDRLHGTINYPKGSLFGKNLKEDD